VTFWVASIVFAASALSAGAVRADGPYEGQWREGPMTIRVEVTSWGGDCGPRPQSTTTPGGGTFNISQAGDQLTFHLRRQRTTRGCWSENRAVRRVSSTHQAGTWRVVCRTRAEDSRGETGRYTIQAVGSDRLNFSDTSEYDWQLNASRCQARMRATQTFTRVGGGGGRSTPTTEPEPRRPRCTPGAAARVILRPAATDVPLGGEQCFSARVVDAEGCTVRGRPTLRVTGGGTLSGQCLTAPDSPGTLRVVASAGSLSAESRVTVRAIDLSDLIARRGETQAVPEPGFEGDATSETASRVSALEPEDAPSLLWPAIAVGAALVLLIFGVIVLRVRGSSKPLADIPLGRDFPLSDRPPAPVSEGDAPDAAYTPDATAATAPPIEAEPVQDGDDMICPKCRRGYAPGTEECVQDGAQLVAYKDFTSTSGENVCPTCGERYPTTVKFCGKDRTRLEPSA